MLNNNNPYKKGWWLLALAVIITLIVGMKGFDTYALSYPKQHLTSLDKLYRTLQLFTLDYAPLVNPIPPELEVARWLAPLITFSIAIVGFLSLLGKKVWSLFKLNKTHRHAIICGLGVEGTHIATKLLNDGIDVITVDINERNKHLPTLEKKGAIAIIGNALNPDVLNQAKIQSARYLIMTTSEDTDNIDIVHQAQTIIKSIFTKKQKLSLDCYARVSDYNTKRLFYNHPLFAESEKRFNAQLFNLYDLGARLLFDEYAPDYFKPVQNKDCPAVSIVIIGFSPLAISLILHAAHTGHYANGKKLLITLVDKNATKELSSLNPELKQIIEVKSYDISVDSINQKTLQDILIDKPSVIYICMNNDVQAITQAHRFNLMGDNKIPVVAGLLQQDAVTRLYLNNKNNLFDSNIYFFPLIDKTSGVDEIIKAEQDDVAKLIHQMYCEDQLGLGESRQSNPTLMPWDDLSEGIKDSNRGQADHLPVKLRAIGLSFKDVIKNSEPLTFTAQDIQNLAEMEHQRWVAGKLLDGWQLTCGKKDLKRKLTPLLINYKDLPDNEKHKDEQTIADIPRLIDFIKSELKSSVIQ